MVDTATAKYLSDNVGPVLAKALAEMAVAQPEDGVAYLATWLKTYAELEEARVFREREEKQLAEERAKVRQKEAEREAAQKAKQDELDALDQARVDLLAKFADREKDFDEKYFSELVALTQKITGASSVYLGIFDEEGIENGPLDDKGAPKKTGPCIRYEWAVGGSESSEKKSRMLEEVLTKEDVCVTFGAFEKKPTDDAFEPKCLWRPPPTELAAPAVSEGQPEPTVPDYYPVYIPCVTDVDTVHYFHMTMLGSYLAVPMVFNTYYGNNAVEDAQIFEDQKKKKNMEYKELIDAWEAEKLAAEDAGAGEPSEVELPEPEAPVEQTMVLRGADVKMVLCMDTLGTNEALPEVRIPQLMELCQACGECKAAYESRQVDNQVLFRMDEDNRTALDEDIERIRGEVAVEQQEKYDAEKLVINEMPTEEGADGGGGSPELKAAQIALLEKKFTYLRARSLFIALKDSVKKISSWVVVSPEVQNLVAGCVLLFGHSVKSIYPRRKSKITWERLKLLLTDALFDLVEATDIDGPRLNLEPEQKLEAVTKLAIPVDYDEEKANKEIWPSFGVFFSFMKAAVDYRAEDVKLRKEEEEKKRAAKAEAGEEVGPELAELDDDFVTG